MVEYNLVALRTDGRATVSYTHLATCDGEFFTGTAVFVVGGGFAAAEESVFLTKYARQVTILIRGCLLYTSRCV